MWPEIRNTDIVSNRKHIKLSHDPVFQKKNYLARI